MRIDLHPFLDLGRHGQPTRLVLNAARRSRCGRADRSRSPVSTRPAGRPADRRAGAGRGRNSAPSGTARREVHLLGYGPRRSDPELNAELERLRVGRTERLPKMLAKLRHSVCR